MSRGLNRWVMIAGVLAMAGMSADALAFGSKPANKTQSDAVAVQGLSQETLSLAQSLDTADTPAQSLGQTQQKSYSLNLKGRWGVKVEVNQAPTRPSGWSDVDAGAFFKVTPSLRVGGTVGFGPKTNALTPAPAQANKPQPRVRVETTFNF